MFSSDSNALLIGLSDGNILFLERTTGKDLLEFERYHQSPIRSLALCPDGKTIMSCAKGDSVFFGICFWSRETGERLMTHKELTGPSHVAVISPDCTSVLIGSEKGVVHFCNLNYCMQRLPALAIMSNSLTKYQKHVGGYRKNSSRISEKSSSAGEADQKSQLELKKRTPGVTAVTISLDKRFYFTGSEDGTACLIDAHSGKILNELKGHTDRIGVVALSQDGVNALTGSDDTTVRLWSKGQLEQVLEGHTKGITAAVVSPDSNFILTGSKDTTARLWDTKTGSCLYTLKGHLAAISTVSFTSNTTISTQSTDGTVAFWEVKTGNLLKVDHPSQKTQIELKEHTDCVGAVAFSPDGNYLLTGSDDKTACLWNALTGKKLSVLKGHTGKINVVAFSHDNKTALTASDDKTVCLWTGGHLTKVLEGHTQGVTAAAFSHDGKLVLTGSRDNKARLWDVERGICRYILGPKEHTTTVNVVAFSR